jgi:hypothetical protein
MLQMKLATWEWVSAGMKWVGVVRAGGAHEGAAKSIGALGAKVGIDAAQGEVYHGAAARGCGHPPKTMRRAAISYPVESDTDVQEQGVPPPTRRLHRSTSRHLFLSAR